MRRNCRRRIWRTIRRVILRTSHANEKKKAEYPSRNCGSDEAANFHSELAANAYRAEAEDDVAAGGGPTKTHHRAEAGEEQHLLELMTQIGAVRSSKNLVIGHLAMGVDGYIDHETMRQRKLKLVLLGRPRLW